MFFEWLEDAVTHHGAAHAVVQRETYLSFRGLLHRAGRRMQELRALGVEPGHAVGILLGNVADYLVLAVAVNQLGATVVPLPPLLSATELALAAASLPLRAIVSRPGIRALDPEEPLDPVATPFALTKRTRLQGSLLSCALFRVDEMPLLPEETALVHLCPGPAGHYRAVARTAAALGAEAEHLAMALAPGDRLRLGVGLPLHQPFTLELVLALTCGYGAELHLDDDLAPRRTFPRVRETALSLIPVTRAFLWSILGLPSPRPLEHPVRLLCVDGPVERDLERAVFKAFGTRPVGLLHRAETGLVSLDPEGRAPHTVGTPVEGVQVRLVGARQAPVAAGRRGALQVRSPATSDGPKVWVDTGDQATQDRTGRLKLYGRTDDQVLVGGVPVSLEEIHETLITHPAVAEAEIRVAPPETPSALDGAALPVALVVRRALVTAETLAAHCGRRLAPHKVPGTFQFVKRLD